MIFGFLVTVLLAACCASAQHVDWPGVGNDPGCMRFSPLDRINQENVKNLEIAWVYKTGELDRPDPKTIECTPIIIDGSMFISTGHLKVVSLDAATGKENWRFDPLEGEGPAGPLASGGVNRGVAFWSDGKPGGERRIIHGAADGRLFSLDAETGERDSGFGEDGTVDLRAGIEHDISNLPYGPTSAPAIFENLIILGFSTGEGPGVAAPGDVRAFDVRTGKEVWRFHTIPRPGQVGHESWEGDSWKNRGGANAWGGFSVDSERGMVFFGLGSAAFDFYGGDRKGQNLFANSVVALNAHNGERVWHFQTLHHDLWDHDLPVYPNLIRIRREGKDIDAAVQVTKTAYVFLFDRETGEPIFEIEEKPVPASTVPGEEAWPTQPVPVKPPPISRVFLSEDELTDLSPEANEEALKRYRDSLAGPAFLPPSLEGTIVIPGFHGGATWAGASFDPSTGFLYVNSNNVPNIVRLIEEEPGKGYAYNQAGYEKFLDSEGFPAIKPPWGLLSAIDLNEGEIVWRVPLGEYPELAKRGVRNTGTENFGGTIVTAGGLVFIGGSMDEKFHAFDKGTGKLLWEHQLPAGGYATPSTYMVGGRQYVIIAAGGAGKPGTKPGEAIIAFALKPGSRPSEK